jgi:hypothetical protein
MSQLVQVLLMRAGLMQAAAAAEAEGMQYNTPMGSP